MQPVFNILYRELFYTWLTRYWHASACISVTALASHKCQSMLAKERKLSWPTQEGKIKEHGQYCTTTLEGSSFSQPDLASTVNTSIAHTKDVNFVGTYMHAHQWDKVD
jgi:hypothetical protein